MQLPASRVRRYGVDRREFLRHLAAVSAIPTIASVAAGQDAKTPTFPSNPFQLGVASGDPEPDGVVLWTRLAPSPLEGGGMPSVPVEVSWELAKDESFKDVVQTGTAMAIEASHDVRK